MNLVRSGIVDVSLGVQGCVDNLRLLFCGVAARLLRIFKGERLAITFRKRGDLDNFLCLFLLLSFLLRNCFNLLDMRMWSSYGVRIIVRLNVEVLLAVAGEVVSRCGHEERMHRRSGVPIFVTVRVVRGVTDRRGGNWMVIRQRMVSVAISGMGSSHVR